jgi:hypothetical protein
MLLLLVCGCVFNSTRENKLPADAAAALHAPEKVVLFSLEPWSQPTANDATFHNFKILGQTKLDTKQAATAISAFEAAIPDRVNRNRIQASCFDPRHALRVNANAQTYDFLLCYACGYIYVYRGNQNIAMLNAFGSPDVLNALLTAAKVPLSKTNE